MALILETERLLIREFEPGDAEAVLRLDSNKEVHRFLHGQMISTIEAAAERVEYIRRQYSTNGIGRWVALLKDNHEFIGWCGMKFVNDTVVDGKTDYYDIGYRLLPEYWNKGYATEASIPCLDYALNTLKVPEIFATVMQGNTGSKKVTEKIGLIYRNDFVYEDGNTWQWFSLKNQLMR